MAGEWLKMEACTPEKSEVLAITARMGWDDTDLTVGKLFRIWRWFDQQTTDGNAASVTPALLDRIVGVTGFCFAMQSVGWLTITDEGVGLPNFDRHNGNTAKNRALTAKRVAKSKGNAKANAQGNAEGNADTVTQALPKEEKKREDISIPNGIDKPRKRSAITSRPDDVPETLWNDFLAVRKAKRAPLTQTALDGIRREAAKARMSLSDAIAMSCSRGWQGFEASWVQGKGVASTQSETPYQRAMRERVAEISPDLARPDPNAAGFFQRIKVIDPIDATLVEVTNEPARRLG